MTWDYTHSCFSPAIKINQFRIQKKRLEKSREQDRIVANELALNMSSSSTEDAIRISCSRSGIVEMLYASLYGVLNWDDHSMEM
jgi:hypothetical protein